MSTPRTPHAASGAESRRECILRRVFVLLAAVGAAHLSATPAGAQRIQGAVLEEGTGAPISQVYIALMDEEGEERASALTDSAGLFRIEAPEAGRYTFALRRIGYVPVATPVVDVLNSQSVDVELRMSAEAIPLEPLVVVQRRWYDVVRLEQFYERAERNAKLGRGHIFFREDIERLVSIRHLMYLVPARPSCPMEVLVDGLPVDAHDGYRDLDSFASPDIVEGVEIYRGPTQMPLEYAHLGACSLMLVWTRPAQGPPFTWKRALIAAGLATLAILLAR